MQVPELSGMTALLTASSAGIPLASAKALASAGVPRIMLNGRREALCRQAVSEVSAIAPGASVRYAVGDATNPHDVEHIVEETVREFGPIGLLVNSVGGAAAPLPFDATDPVVFTRHVDAHLMSVLYVTRAVLPHMTGGGTVINFASDAAKVPTPGEAIIGALKAAVAMFSRTLSLEVGRSGIRVHCITPSIVRGTATYDRVMAEPFSKKLFEKAERRAKLGVVTPDDIAPLVVFLASPAAARMTGQVLSVNGGISAG